MVSRVFAHASNVTGLRAPLKYPAAITGLAS
jgi:hypothetical protein